MNEKPAASTELIINKENLHEWIEDLEEQLAKQKIYNHAYVQELETAIAEKKALEMILSEFRGQDPIRYDKILSYTSDLASNQKRWELRETAIMKQHNSEVQMLKEEIYKLKQISTMKGICPLCAYQVKREIGNISKGVVDEVSKDAHNWNHYKNIIK
jgi:hypothetical protein